MANMSPAVLNGNGSMRNGNGRALGNGHAGYGGGATHGEYKPHEPSSVWIMEISRETQLMRVGVARDTLSLDAVSGLEMLLRSEAGGLPGIALDLHEAAVSQPVLKAVLQAVEHSGIPCKRLNLQGNRLHDDDLQDLIAFVLRQSQALELLDCSNNNFTAHALARLCTAMESHPGRAYPDVSDGFAVPCQLNFSENCVSRESQAMQVLRDGGIKVCTMVNCAPGLCSLMAPVHYEGLGRQRDVVPWNKADLLSLLPVRSDLRPTPNRLRIDWQGLPEPVPPAWEAPEWLGSSCEAPQSKPGQMSRGPGPAASGAPPSIPGFEL